MTSLKHILIFVCLIVSYEGASILVVIPTPSISHQVLCRPIIMELVKRGHEVVHITTDPVFKNKVAPANLTEIDVHDVSYEIWRKEFLLTDVSSGNSKDLKNQVEVILNVMTQVFEEQMKVDEIQKLLNYKSQKFDLLILESYISPPLGWSHIFKAPVIQITSLGSVEENIKMFGAVSHPLLFPTFLHQKVYNLTLWDKLTELRNEYNSIQSFNLHNKMCDNKLNKMFGTKMPPLKELKNAVDMYFVNVYPIWERNRPVPPNVIYIGGLHLRPPMELPQDIKTFLDSSKNGVIYISFGTNVEPALLPPEKIQAIVKAVSKLPYDVLWKWNQDEMPGKTPNIKISKWLPQPDLLRHPNVKLFITQGGQQSTDEAIIAGVPLIGIPILGDQWFNVEQYVHNKIGLKVDMDTITEEKIENAIKTILNDDSYRQNMIRFRDQVWDQPQTPLERAVWWTEYVIRHSGARHLRPPSANMPWHEYYELELVTYVVVALISLITLCIITFYYLYKLICKQLLTNKLTSFKNKLALSFKDKKS